LANAYEKIHLTHLFNDINIPSGPFLAQAPGFIITEANTAPSPGQFRKNTLYCLHK
jgi:hypothetical protein